MPPPQAQADKALAAFIGLAGEPAWQARLACIRRSCTPGHAGRAFARLHAMELMIDRLRRPGAEPANAAEQEICALAAALGAEAGRLSAPGRARLAARLAQALDGENTIIPLLHLMRCARLHQARGYDVHFAGLEDGAPFDLLISRDFVEAEIICDVMSAETGRDVHRGAWSHLVDRVDPELQSWLASHPGRYLLKMTLPQGLKAGMAAADDATAALADLHGRITRMLTESRRADHDEAAVLRLEPLLLAGAQASELGLMRGLRQEFGHEAHLAVTASGGGVFVMAARAAREDEVAEAVQRRMALLAPSRFSGTRPGIISMFIEDTDRLEWRLLRDQLRIEGAARQFLTTSAARQVVAVTCASRHELCRCAPPDAAEEGELRFRNPSHPMAKAPALAAAVVSLS